MASERYFSVRYVGSLYLDDGGKIPVVKRGDDDSLPGLWELPGGTLRPSEKIPAGLRREAREEAGVNVTVSDEAMLIVIREELEKNRVTMHMVFPGSITDHEHVFMPGQNHSDVRLINPLRVNERNRTFTPMLQLVIAYVKAQRREEVRQRIYTNPNECKSRKKSAIFL